MILNSTAKILRPSRRSGMDHQEADAEHAVQVAGEHAHPGVAAARRRGSSRPSWSNRWSSQMPRRGSGTLVAARRNMTSETRVKTPNGTHRASHVGILLLSARA